MSAATAPGMAESYIYATLSGDATLMALISAVYSTVAPEGALYPFVVFASVGGKDIQEIGPNRTMSQQLYAIKAVSNVPSIAALDTIMARVDALLQGHGPVTLPGGYTLGVRREQTMVLGDPVAGVQYRQMVAIYRFYMQEGHG